MKGKKQTAKILELPSEALADLKDFAGENAPLPQDGGDGSYIVRDGCVYRQAGDNTIKLVANFTAQPIEELTRDDGQEQSKCFVFDGKLFNGVPFPRVTVPAQEFQSMNWITKHWGLSAAISPTQTSTAHFRSYLQGQAVGIPTRTEYTHTGWRKIGGKWCFLHGGGALGLDGVECRLEGDLTRYIFIPAEDITPQEAARETLKLWELAPSHISYPMLSFMYLAALSHFLGLAGITPSFSLFAAGETGSFKTVMSMLYLSSFREYAGMSETPPTNFHSTANAIEKMAFTLKDMPLLIDDYHPTTTTDKKRMDGIAQRTARGAGDHISRGRMNSDTTLKASYSPRGLVMVTGEDAPDIGQSGLARYYFVQFEKGMIDKDKLTERQGKARYYNANMQNFILWLAKSADTLPDTLSKMFHDLVRRVNIEDSHARTAPNVAWLQLGITMFSEYMYSVGAMSESEVQKFRDSAWLTFIDAGQKQTKIQRDEQPIIKFLGLVDEFLSNDRKRTRHMHEMTENSVRPGDWWGYHDEERYYFFPTTVYNDICMYLNSLGANFPISKQRLFNDLAKIGLIESQGERNTVKKRIGSDNLRWLVVPRSSFDIVRGE